MSTSTFTTIAVVTLLGCGALVAQDSKPAQAAPKAAPQAAPPAAGISGGPSSVPLAQVKARMEAERPAVEARHAELLAKRYDLADTKAPGATMTGGKAVQAGPRTKLKAGTTWDSLAAMSPADIHARDLFPEGFLPLPHANHPEGGMLFPKSHIDEVLKQTGRDLNRFDLGFDVPEHLLPDFPQPMFLTTRPDLGDVSQGQLVTLSNYYELFKDILNPKQLEGLRLLLTPFPQAQFNATDERRSALPSQGVACLDCHANGHTNGANHLVGDIRPQEFRHRIETPTLRGVNVQRLFGSQRALKSVEDFTEFEQRAAYFDGDPVAATKKGVNILERGSQVHFMGEFQALLDFPPAPKLGLEGRLDPALASEQEMRGQQLFFGKADCGGCHPAPYYTDNLMHDLKTERFYEKRTIAGHTMVGDGKIKTFPLRGIKDSPPFLHDGRLLTLDDTVEFFNLVTGVKLTKDEKADLVSFLLAL